MVDEQRRYNWMDKSVRPPIYDYVQNRILEKLEEDKYMGLIFTADSEEKAFKAAIIEAAQKAPEVPAEKQTISQ